MIAFKEVELFDVALQTNRVKKGVTVIKQVGSSDPTELLTVCDEGILIEYPSDRDCMIINLDEVIERQATIEDIPDYLKTDIVKEYLSNTVDIPPKKEVSFTDDELKMLHSLFYHHLGVDIPHSQNMYNKLKDYFNSKGIYVAEGLNLKSGTNIRGDKAVLCPA